MPIRRRRVDRASDLGLVVDLDEESARSTRHMLDQRHQLLLFQSGDDQQREVGTERPRLPQLVAGDDEILAAKRGPSPLPDGGEVGRLPETTPLGEHADGRGATRLIVCRQARRSAMAASGPLTGTGTFHFGDNRDALSAEHSQRIDSRVTLATRSFSSAAEPRLRARQGLP